MDLNLSRFNNGCPDDQQMNSSNLANIKLRFSPSFTISICIIYLLPFCFGIFGNVSVCLIFFQQKKLRSITNTFLMNLCINDLIVLCVSIPMTLFDALLEDWVSDTFLCKFLHFTPTVTALVSTFTVAIIAVERWLFIVNKRKLDRYCTILTLILLWLGSISIAMPEFISRQLINSVDVLQKMMKEYSSRTLQMNNETMLLVNHLIREKTCKMEKKKYCDFGSGLYMRVFSYIVITMQYLVPFLFVSVSCYSISRFLKRRMIRMRAYQIQHRHPQKPAKFPRKQSSNITDETTDQELTSCDDSLTVKHLNHNIKSNYFFLRFRQTILHRDDLPEHLNYLDDQHILKSQSHTKRRFHRSRKLLICVAALLTFSWLPLTIVQLYLEHNVGQSKTHDEADFTYGYLLIPCYLISSLSAWINPIIYNYINRSFRREFYSLYSCCFKASSSASTSRKEFTLIGSKKHRSVPTHLDKTNVDVLPCRVVQHGSHSVSFADETTVMLHGQS